jgi:hypothetical protein
MADDLERLGGRLPLFEPDALTCRSAQRAQGTGGFGPQPWSGVDPRWDWANASLLPQAPENGVADLSA